MKSNTEKLPDKRKFAMRSNSPLKLLCVILLIIGAASVAHATDSPDTIYVDGQPCGSFCRSWMGIPERPVPSRAFLEALEPRRAATGSVARAVKSDARKMRTGAAVPAIHTPLPKRKPPALFAKIDLPKDGKTSPPVLAEPLASLKPDEVMEANANQATDHMPADQTATVDQAKHSVADSASAPTSAGSTEQKKQTVTAAVAATAVMPGGSGLADVPYTIVSSAEPTKETEPVPREPASDRAESSVEAATGSLKLFSDTALLDDTIGNLETTPAIPRNVNADRTLSAPSDRFAALLPPASLALTAPETKPAVPSPIGSGARVAILMTRPEILSLSDLISRNVAIDGRQSNAQESVRMALAAAGASDLQLTENRAKALDRLMGGEVSAAVLALVSSAAAENFPDIAGFKIFRIPLAN